MEKVEFEQISYPLRPGLVDINPDYQWNVEDFIKLSVDECWNLAEITEEGYMSLKHLFYRIIVPKEHWDDCTYDKFLKLTKQRYMEQISEE